MIKHFLLLFLFFQIVYAWKMEADFITVKRTRNDTITHINFRQKYDTPPLVFTIPTTQGINPATLRIVNVTTSGFDIYTIEPQNEDGPHTRMTKVPYIAIEPGEHTFPDGTKIVAKTISTKKAQQKNSFFNFLNWESVRLSGFNTTPVVLAQIQTRNNERSDESVPDAVSKPWLSVAIANISSRGFNIALERSETNEGTISKEETIAYLAIDSNLNGQNHYFADNTQTKVEYETIATDNKIVGWDDGGVKVNFSKSYTNPVAVANKASRNEGDGGWFRESQIESDGITLLVDEDRAYDNERSHQAEKASILLFSKPFDTEFLPDSNVRMLINEVMYKETQTGVNNDEFIEFYVTQSGDLKGVIVSDQDKNYYRFPSCSVQKGDYVILHIGGNPSNNSCSGLVKHFYQGSNPYLNSGTNKRSDNDDILLLAPGEDVTQTTQNNGKIFNAFPIDYIAYGKNKTGGNIDSIPTSMKGVTLSFDYTKGAELAGASAGQSISLTPNANDSDKAACWELTESANGADNGCENYKVTTDSNIDNSITASLGNDNNALPKLDINKSSLLLQDPINNDNNPKRVPGSILRYCFEIDNSGIAIAKNVTIKDSFENKTNIRYIKAGALIQSNSMKCNCLSTQMDENKASFANNIVTIDIGTLGGTTAPDKSRACAFIEVQLQ